ncbi:amidase signature enzyme [Coniophora puteana RWD-64-598 SS2]|uniref:Glutamyl-tRNA(Gln) amidotransferase subunit A, mitochondrial n=1 Tax=Coniophora puteana (strain RWD-64-598) TaxID=741705 RepID=A0A5M3M8B2_CONPW|nr:amidase signature enzyme [Coniophora puteana RWD-64-598 SS2]EIW75283.1 amidase signature enzyme [Coniophora puteana RWD-64-598 SS2]
MHVSRVLAAESWRAAVESRNKCINALIAVAPNTSTHGPSTSQTKSAKLEGLSLAVKDNIATRDLRTTCASRLLSDYTPPFDATAVRLLRDAGASVIGKANCDEFGMGSLNTHSAFGPVVNPYDPNARRSAGGSSGGSAAAVAAGFCDAALGTDTGGSVRLPASYCGVVGFKPSYGIISRWGVVSFADSLDCVGVLTHTVKGAQAVFDVIAQHDPRDPTAAPTHVRKRASAAVRKHAWGGEHTDGDLKGLRIGIPQEYFPAELSPPPGLHTLLSHLQSHGASLVPVSLPATRAALSAYYVLASAEASSDLARFDGVRYGQHVPPAPGTTASTADVYAHTRSVMLGREVRKRILLGSFALSAGAFDNYYLQAQRVRSRVRSDFDAVFRVPNALRAPPAASTSNPITDIVAPNEPGVDVLLHPSAIGPAPPLPSLEETETGKEREESLDTYLQDVLTVPASLAGLPALSVPLNPRSPHGDETNSDIGEGEWPVGVSVVGQWGADELVFRVGKVVEKVVREMKS